jgi:hypothetical protein
MVPRKPPAWHTYMVRLAFPALLAFTACAASSQFTTRAAFELQCSERDLEFTDLGRNTWGVIGCGKQATYQRLGRHWHKVDEKSVRMFEFDLPTAPKP